MNSRGYTKDNIHKGNTKIIAGGIDVDGLVRIGDQSVGGDGYVLPSIKGNEGDILTMNADNTTSFKSSSLASARVVQNLFQMEIPTYYYTNDGGPDEYVRMYSTNTGSDIIDTSQIAVGGVIRMRTKGYVYNDINNEGGNPISFGQFRIFIGIDNAYGDFFCDSSQSLPVIDSAGMGANPSFGRGWWSIEVNIVKLDELNNCYVGIAGLYNGVNTSGTSADTFDLQFYSYDPTQRRWPNASGSTLSPSNFYSPMPSTFQLRLSWRATQGNAYAIATEYTIDYLNIDQGVLATVSAPATDHNTLSNLNVGDPHQLYAYLGGRSGGQVLSGGITPSNFLTLKSHTAGLPNITIKDLNTQFNKNIDLDSNDIINGNDVKSNQVSVDTLTSKSGGDITVNKNVNIGTNSIKDGANNIIDFLLGDMTLLNTSPTNVIAIASQKDVLINAFNEIKISNPPTITRLSITPTTSTLSNDIVGISGEISAVMNDTTTNMYVAVGSSSVDIAQSNAPSPPTEIVSFTPTATTFKKDINMDNNKLELASEVSSLKYTLIGTDIESPITNIIRLNTVGGIAPTFSPSQLDMNNGSIVSIGNFLTTNGSSNIDLPVVVGVPSGAFQVQNGGAYIKQDLQVDGAIYCDTINNIRPSGGLYSESSGFNITSANLTETNLLGQGGSSGALAIPANTFTQFDSYSFKASGVLSGGSNDIATLRLKSLVNGTTPVELGSIVIQLTDNGLVDVAWKVEADFNVRTLGGAGVGVLVLNGNFAYTNNNDVVKTYLRTIVNNSVFDTTQSNELQFTYQNDGTNPLINIRIDQASFTKWY